MLFQYEDECLSRIRCFDFIEKQFVMRTDVKRTLVVRTPLIVLGFKEVVRLHFTTALEIFFYVFLKFEWLVGGLFRTVRML